jgi:hypothetical protein
LPSRFGHRPLYSALAPPSSRTTLRSIRKESPGRDLVCVLSCSRFLRRSSGWAARQETTPALKPATLSIRDADRVLFGTLRRLGSSACCCPTGGNARGIAFENRSSLACCKVESFRVRECKWACLERCLVCHVIAAMRCNMSACSSSWSNGPTSGVPRELGPQNLSFAWDVRHRHMAAPSPRMLHPV